MMCFVVVFLIFLILEFEQSYAVVVSCLLWTCISSTLITSGGESFFLESFPCRHFWSQNLSLSKGFFGEQISLFFCFF